MPKGPYTERQIRALFRLWQKRLGLDLWEIRIVFEALDPETTNMRCHRSELYENATIKVQPWVVSGVVPKEHRAGKSAISAMEVEKGVVHELLHCHIAPQRCWQGLLEPETHRDAMDVACRAYDTAEERVVDKLAVALVRAFGGK